MKKILFSLMTLVLVVGLVGGGAFAYFSDTETSTGNTFTAGTLDLKFDADATSAGVNWVDDNNLPTYNSIYGAAVDSLKPGDTAHTMMGIKNAGTVDGIADIHFKNVVNNENGIEEPEGAVDSTGGALEGELGANLLITITYDGGKAPISGAVVNVSLDDLNSVNTILGPLAAGADTDVTVDIQILSTVGNEIQGDDVDFDVEFSLWQVGAPAVDVTP